MSPQLEWLGVDLSLREPDGEPEGALVLNHGRAADENDLYALLDELDPDRRLLRIVPKGPWVDFTEPHGRG